MKRLPLVVVLGALVAGLTGCDVSPPAATVNGAAISQSTLDAQLSSDIGDANAQCATQLQSALTDSPLGVGTQDDGTTPNAVTPSFADNVLQILVLDQIERQTLARRGVTVTAADVAAATNDYQSQLSGQLSQAQSNGSAPSGCSLTTTSPVSTQLPRSFLRRHGVTLADQEMFEVAVGHLDLGLAALEAYYAAHRAQVTQECLNVLLSDTMAGAQRVHDQIAAGASFATASAGADVDKQASPTGGQLPCEYPSVVTGQLGAALATTVNALGAGQLAPPLPFQTQTSTGAPATYYLVVQMRQRQLVPFAALRGSIREAILAAHSAVVGAALVRLIAQAHVSVDPRYGVWNPSRGIAVPTPPTPAFVLNAKANVPAKPLLSIGGLNLSGPPGG